MNNSTELNNVNTRLKNKLIEAIWSIRTIKRNLDPEFCVILQKHSYFDRTKLRNLYFQKLILQQEKK